MLDIADAHARSADPTDLLRAPRRDADSGDLLLLPFRVAPCQQVLMIWRKGAWSLPAAPRRRTMSGHASAALAAQTEAGVAGRIFKRSILCELEGRRVRIYPFLVREVLPAAAVTRGWAAPAIVATIVGAELDAPLSLFLDRFRVPAAPKRRHRN
jgi:hypothetical protein